MPASEKNLEPAGRRLMQPTTHPIMNTTRNGKIARLPEALRRQLNHRLQDGELGPQLVAWLNALPEVQAVMQAEFAGHPVREQNLSEWRQGGYAEWLEQEEALETAGRIIGNVAEWTQTASGPLTDKMALWTTTRCLVAARRLERAAPGDEKAWNRLRELCQTVAALRRGDHRAQRLELAREKFAAKNEDDQAQALRLCLQDSKPYPDIVEKFQAVFQLLKDRRAGRNPTPKRGENPAKSD